MNSTAGHLCIQMLLQSLEINIDRKLKLFSNPNQFFLTNKYYASSDLKKYTSSASKTM